MFLSKDRFDQTAWHMAADNGRVEVKQKLCDLAKELQLTPEELKNEVFLRRDRLDKSSWQWAANSGHVEIIHKMWGFSKEL
jgi:ankyrin repeat protein